MRRHAARVTVARSFRPVRCITEEEHVDDPVATSVQCGDTHVGWRFALVWNGEGHPCHYAVMEQFCVKIRLVAHCQNGTGVGSSGKGTTTPITASAQVSRFLAANPAG